MRDVFRPSFGNRPSQIVGRDDVIAEFRKGLSKQPGDRRRATLILGQRGMGKTALLMELADRARDMGFVATRVIASETMLDEIIETIQIEGSRYVKQERSKVKGFSVGAVGFSFGLTFAEEVRENYGFRVKLSLLCDKLAENGKGILILVDEVQSNTPEMRTLAATYQHLAGDGKNIAIAMAGLPGAVSHVLNDKVLTFLNRAEKVHLGALRIGEVRAYYAKVFAEMGKNVSSEALDKAAQVTAGFPYLLQLVGYYLVEYTEGRGEITLDDVDQAFESARLDLDDDVFKTALQPLSDKDRAFLRAMAEDDGLSKTSDVQQRMGVDQKYVQVYRSRLIQSGIIESPARGELQFTLPYFDAYLRELE